MSNAIIVNYYLFISIHTIHNISRNNTHTNNTEMNISDQQNMQKKYSYI